MDDQQSGSGEEDDSSEESSSDGEPVVPFLATREKRPNAGNRMSQLLEQEFAEEEGFEDQADDIEFEAKGWSTFPHSTQPVACTVDTDQLLRGSWPSSKSNPNSD